MLRELLDITRQIARQQADGHMENNARFSDYLEKLFIIEQNRDEANKKTSVKTDNQDFTDTRKGPFSPWEDLVSHIADLSPLTRSYLLEAKGHFNVDCKTLSIFFPMEFAEHARLINNKKNITLIQTKLADMGLDDWEVFIS